MKRKLICIGLCVFSLSLLIGGCADGAIPTESPPAIEEAAKTSSPEAGEVVEKNIESTPSPKPSASPTLRLPASASPTPTATQINNSNVGSGNGGASVATSQPVSANGVANQTPAESTKPPAAPTPAPTPDPNAGKTWYDDVYEDVWVVDEPARTVEEPVFEMRERTYCFICNTDITGNIPTHGDMHFDRDEDFQYGGKPVQVEVGVKQVTIPEKGHWEKKLVRKAGWY
ncbi:hypothetical protein LJC56_12015 [Christensenellaceae bacterium OttesenSCG-928-K19]|nr:hypothetical protein [Christensenellaceae bacterium OttesenSCG-928-K19]